MLTRIEIDGFKSFRDFSLDLEPFQVIVGANGVGKSNLFDAMQLLARLAEHDLWTAFQAIRGGSTGELFFIKPGGQPVDEMKFAVELLVEPHVRDAWGRSGELQDTRLRYELIISHEYDEKEQRQLFVRQESLNRIPISQDRWLERHQEIRQTRFIRNSQRGDSFISTTNKNNTNFIDLQDGQVGPISLGAESMKQTALNAVNSADFAHIFAARKEMRQWLSLQLMNINKLRQSNSVLGPTMLSASGDNLARTLARIVRDEKYILNDISRDLSNLVPGLLNVEIEEDKVRNIYNIYVNTQDERRLSSYALSDGTLRLLALVTLANDPEYQGVLCIEEPENGVHPFCAEQIVEQMRSLATDFADEDDVAWPLRQLLVNTHSPLLLAQLQDKELLLAYMPTLIAPADGGDVGQVTRIVPTSRQAAMWSDQQTPISRHQIEKYLHSADWDAAVERLVGDGAA